MKRGFSAFLFVICLCSGCVSDAERRVETTGVSSPDCPSAYFVGFLKMFMEDENVQRQWTHLPLKELSLDYAANPEPEPRVRMLNREEIKFPIIPNNEKKEKSGLEFKVEEFPACGAKVVFYMEDSGWLVYYFFNAVNGCWKLTEIQDWSM